MKRKGQFMEIRAIHIINLIRYFKIKVFDLELIKDNNKIRALRKISVL
jgi:hypothetical protein